MPPVPANTPKKESAGPIVGTIIIVILLILGGFYFWSSHQRSSQDKLPFVTSDNSVSVQ